MRTDSVERPRSHRNSPIGERDRPRVVYVSPNRSHHYRYAEGLERAGLLWRFVSGFPRYNRSAGEIRMPAERILRRDRWQLLYLAASRSGAPDLVVEWLNARSKRALGRAFSQEMRQADVGLFYNGTGLQAVRKWLGHGKLFICEAVNTHVEVQRRILKAEADRLGIVWELPNAWEISGRVAEYRESDYVLAPSRFVAESFAAEGIPASRCLVNPYGMPLPPDVGLGERREGRPLTVLYVGQLNFRKGLRYLVEAFARVPVVDKQLRLVGPVVPPTGLEDLELPAEVEMCGVLKGPALARAFRDADVFVQPSLEEGLSLVIGEAMGHGLPVVASDCTGAEEILVHGDSGFIFPARDVDALATLLSRLVEDGSLRREIGANARRLAASFSGWEASGERLAEQLREVWGKFQKWS